MRGLRWCLTFLVFVTAAALPIGVRGQEFPADAIRHGQAAQQRIRDMARRVVTSVLDLQLRQMEENRFEKTPLYKEMQDMRGEIDTLVETQMPEIVRLLSEAENAAAEETEVGIGIKTYDDGNETTGCARQYPPEKTRRPLAQTAALRWSSRGPNTSRYLTKS